MAKISFNPTPAPTPTPVTEAPTEPTPVYDYSPKFDKEKAASLDAVIHALKLSQEPSPEDVQINTEIAKYQKIIRLLRSL